MDTSVLMVTVTVTKFTQGVKGCFVVPGKHDADETMVDRNNCMCAKQPYTSAEASSPPSSLSLLCVRVCVRVCVRE